MTPAEAMARAVFLSGQGLGRTCPNPVVGAVIIGPKGEFISEGFHGGVVDHAEVVAIKNASKIPGGSTMYVTLEPCNHTGKTGPCTQAIITAGISHVVYAVSDPNPIAQGGAENLRSAGVSVQSGTMESEAGFLNRDWLTKITLGRPRFAWKIGITLDGKIAAKDGSSQWITSEESREEVARLRGQSDAILIGTGTAIADNPHLTTQSGKPTRIVMGNRTIAADAHLHDASAPTEFIVGQDFDLLLDFVNKKGFNRVLIESGPTLGTAALQAGLIDELIIFQAPTILGTGQSFVGDLGITKISERMDFDIVSTTQFGVDNQMILTRRAS
jgi:diaminohydroxyphosphoribosylaminopyrimidine deaminase/5-amino-6-(5-phosphoribosylamino)uracil reductase